VAGRFLTRLPLPEVAVGQGDLRRAAPAFPLVGLVVAAAGVAVRAAAAPLLGPLAATVLACAAMVMLTGALHEDGLADTVDGFWGGWDPERRLAIMRDSAVGTFGVLALVGVAGLRVALLAGLGLADFARAVACGHVLGRAAMVLAAGVLPPAAPGRGAEVTGRPSNPGAAVAAGTTVLTLGLAVTWWAPVVAYVALAVTAGMMLLCRRRIGGVTGDTLGAICQLVEVATIAAVAAVLRAPAG
jgi:adenosylcobinamide-GDP ribazoletransferase